jgi:hypothetical protein
MREFELRRFNSKGLDEAADAIIAVKQGEDVDLEALLVDPSFTEVVAKDVKVSPVSFSNRFEAAEYFDNLLGPLETNIPEMKRDRGLWTWLSLVWVDVLAPVGTNGLRKPGDIARWIPQTETWSRYYRHLLLGPYLIYRAHKDNPARAMAVLASPVARPGDVVENIVSRQDLVTSPNLMSAVTDLYYDKSKGVLRRGSATKGPGSARRLAQVLSQFDLTWDIYGMPPSVILALLPAEFERFMAGPGGD